MGGGPPRPPRPPPGFSFPGASPGGGGGGAVVAVALFSGEKPGGFGRVASRCNPDAASAASWYPPLRPMRGSSDGARGLVKTVVVGDPVLSCPKQSSGRQTMVTKVACRVIIFCP